MVEALGVGAPAGAGAGAGEETPTPKRSKYKKSTSIISKKTSEELENERHPQLVLAPQSASPDASRVCAAAVAAQPEVAALMLSLLKVLAKPNPDLIAIGNKAHREFNKITLPVVEVRSSPSISVHLKAPFMVEC
jgi:hypothetical protein